MAMGGHVQRAERACSCSDQLKVHVVQPPWRAGRWCIVSPLLCRGAWSDCASRRSSSIPGGACSQHVTLIVISQHRVERACLITISTRILPAHTAGSEPARRSRVWPAAWDRVLVRPRGDGERVERKCYSRPVVSPQARRHLQRNTRHRWARDNPRQAQSQLGGICV